MLLKPDTLGMTVMLALLAALGPLSTDMYLPSLPAIARELNATTAETQLTLSSFLLGFAVGQFVYGRDGVGLAVHEDEAVRRVAELYEVGDRAADVGGDRAHKAAHVNLALARREINARQMPSSNP